MFCVGVYVLCWCVCFVLVCGMNVCHRGCVVCVWLLMCCSMIAQSTHIHLHTSAHTPHTPDIHITLTPPHHHYAPSQELCSDTQRAQVTAYAQEATRKSDLERTELAKDKTGVFTGMG